MSGPLAGFGGKPILGSEDNEKRYIGRIVIELYESPGIRSDGDGLVFSISPAEKVDISQDALLRRFAAALPARVAKMGNIDQRRRESAKKKGGIY
jgi:hypothetical protein